MIFSQQAYSERINVGYDDFNNPDLNVINPNDGSTIDTSLISNWSFLYEDNDGTGTLTINANLNAIGAVQINNANVTTNNNGSLHVDGIVNFIDLSASGHFFGDMFIDVDLDDAHQVTTFNFIPITISGQNYKGFLMTDGPLTLQLLDFHVTSTLLAIIDNPFPMYSPVPIPAAVWLFGSGLLSLVGFSRRNKFF